MYIYIYIYLLLFFIFFLSAFSNHHFVFFDFSALGVSVTSSNTGVPDISGSVYTKTQVSMLVKMMFVFVGLTWSPKVS